MKTPDEWLRSKLEQHVTSATSPADASDIVKSITEAAAADSVNLTLGLRQLHYRNLMDCVLDFIDEREEDQRP